MRKKVLVYGLCLLGSICTLSAKDKKDVALYKDPKAPIEKRVNDLLSRMTLEEKVMQLNQYTLGRNNNVNNVGEEVKKVPAEIGSLIYFETNPALRNSMQKKAMEESRLGIPIIFGYDAIHGFRTVYPISLAQACSWNPDLVEQACAVSAQEARMSGVDWTFSPMIDVARDPRWGRVAEGYGEDPYTNGVFGAASVKGYQGDDLSAENRMAACLKHYVGYGASEAGEKEKDGDRLQQSVNTYEQISGQLNDFYETPKETANSDLERKVDELNKKLEEAEKEKNKAATREELMERSYKMAAKYLNPDKDTVQEKAVGKEPTETVPVQRAEYQTTSGLSQPVTDSAYIASLTVERNYGFNTAVGNSYQMGTNTIAACIPENQIIEQGGRVKLRLLQPLQAGNITVPENSLVTGAAVIQGERLDILISSIEYAGNIIPVQLATYDIDGQKGIFVPGSETRNAAKDAAGTVSESMGNSVSFARSAGQQVVMDLTRGVMQGGTRLIAGRVRAVKVTLKAGYKVLLVTKRQ